MEQQQITAADRACLGEAHAQARHSIGLSEPNPRVGCVIVSPDGLRVLGRGHTQARGEAHAEIMALRDAAAGAADVRGATAYVTLEPCSHHGRTGPCCDALVAAGIRRVVAAAQDPNPLVSGSGFARLRAAGVSVAVDDADGETRALNIGFFSRMERGRPWVRMKIAASLDGVTALEGGASQWITSPEARADGHAWRARAGAVLTGIGTVRDDDPRLDVRLAPVRHQPAVVVVDSRLELRPDAALFTGARATLVYTATDTDSAAAGSLRAAGADIVAIRGAGGKVDLAGMLRDLGSREINELHVEAGHKLNGSLLRERLVDELLLYLAPSLLGPGRPLADLPPLASLSARIPLEFTGATAIGPDLRITARLRPPGAAGSGAGSPRG